MFDFAPTHEPQVVQDLRAARKLLEPGFLKFTGEGSSNGSVRFCVGGAIARAVTGTQLWAGERFIAASQAIDRELDRRGFCAGPWRYVAFNNAASTTHADILGLVDDTIGAELARVPA